MPCPPSSMIKRYTEKLIEEQTKKNKNLDPEKLKEEGKKAAEYNVKWFIIKDKIPTLKVAFDVSNAVGNATSTCTNAVMYAAEPGVTVTFD